MATSVWETAAERRRELDAQGYLVVDKVVPRELCEDVLAATADFLGIVADEPGSWRTRTTHGHGIVPLHHHPALWALRQWPEIHRLFGQLYGTDRLWVTMDRVSFKAPADQQVCEANCRRARQDAQAPRMSAFHWDADPRQPRAEAGFQGLVYLRDTAPEQGAFCCLPDVYARLDDWLGGRQVREAIEALNTGEHRVEAVGGGAGAMVIWHRHMPHSSALNHGTAPRWVQYVAMDPVGDEATRKERIRLFREKRPPAWAVRQRVPGQQDPEPGPTAELTPLGRQLVGFD
ncbi:MAG: phytanoyl-CoA dioxygenase family protein [Gammaproteobacteria bacterium]|nr:phytanoyl-CoA dioxygenase family protein [Gammaproteobacteria bacterium]